MEALQTGLKKLQSGYDWLMAKTNDQIDQLQGEGKRLTNGTDADREGVRLIEKFKEDAGRIQQSRKSQSTTASFDGTQFDEQELEKMSPNSVMALTDKVSREEASRAKCEHSPATPLQNEADVEDAPLPEFYIDSKFKEFTAEEWFYVQFGKRHTWTKMFVEIATDKLIFKNLPDTIDEAIFSKINISDCRTVTLDGTHSYISIETGGPETDSFRIKPAETTKPPNIKYWSHILSGKLQALNRHH